MGYVRVSVRVEVLTASNLKKRSADDSLDGLPESGANVKTTPPITVIRVNPNSLGVPQLRVALDPDPERSNLSNTKSQESAPMSARLQTPKPCLVSLQRGVIYVIKT